MSVLEGLDLQVTPGEKVAIIGRSGAGKTTILRLLMGLERPTAGKVLLNGQVVWDEPGALDMKRVRAAGKHMGFVFQLFNLFPHMTSPSRLTLGPMYAQGVDRRTGAGEAPDRVAPSGRARGQGAGLPPRKLSGGQQQRVAIARALAGRTRRSFCSTNPTSALDPELVGEVLSVDRGPWPRDSDVTMLLVTHEMSFARRISGSRGLL